MHDILYLCLMYFRHHMRCNGCGLKPKRELPFPTGLTFWFFIRTGHFFSVRIFFTKDTLAFLKIILKLWQFTAKLKRFQWSSSYVWIFKLFCKYSQLKFFISVDLILLLMKELLLRFYSGVYIFIRLYPLVKKLAII